MELTTFQQLFYEAVFEHQDGIYVKKLYQHIKAARNLTTPQGFTIYQSSILGKLSRALQSIYPVCHRLVGEAFFTRTAITYIRQYPSTSPDLGDYGEHFASFLAQFKPAASLPYLSEVANLEWYWHRIFNGEDTTTLNFEALAQISQTKWGNLIFQLPKTHVLLESPYPIHRIWQINQPDYEGDDVVHLKEGYIKIFLWRDGYDMRMDLPTEAEWQLLKAFQAEQPFELICEKIAAHSSTLDVPALLTQFVQQRWIASFAIKKE